MMCTYFHTLNIVGLADKALNESRERINSALKNSGIKPPTRENRKITVNLAPADIKKAGSQYDLAIALGYLIATGQMKDYDTQSVMAVGELALDGRIRPIMGALNIAQAARDHGFKFLLVPAENANEASVVSEIKIIPIDSLQNAIEFLENRKQIEPWSYSPRIESHDSVPDMAEIKGQEHGKRALAIAAAGGHNMLMMGPPGVGKSLLAKALVGILPKLTIEEAIEITRIYSAAGLNLNGLIHERPFRSPHQTASLVSIVGGGTNPRPGEISLAHRGILFLDEVPEFPKNVLEALRQPLEDGIVRVARAKGTLTFPAKFSLIAAMNPCPCGYYGDPEKECRCTAFEVLRYQKKISGPLLDRIDLQIQIPRVDLEELRNKTEKSESAKIKEIIEAARERQAHRFKGKRIHTNSEMSSREIELSASLDSTAEQFLTKLHKTQLSPRGYYRLLKTARTIADLEDAPNIKAEHLAEAFSFRLREEV